MCHETTRSGIYEKPCEKRAICPVRSRRLVLWDGLIYERQEKFAFCLGKTKGKDLMNVSKKTLVLAGAESKFNSSCMDQVGGLEGGGFIQF